LNDPSAIDPDTHLPLNGRIQIEVGAVKVIDRSLAVNEHYRELSVFTRSFINGLTRDGMADMGVPGPVFDRMVRGPMTIKIGLRGRVRLVDFAQMWWSARIMGN
jgi:hypothetical protein